MVDREALSARLSALDGYLAKLTDLARLERQEFLDQPAVHHLAERYLHLACECVLDISHHLISDLGLRQPVTYRDVVAVLREAEILTPSLAERLARWMGFRNVLVHAYVDLDHARVHDAMRNDLGDLREFARMAAAFLS